MKKKILSITLAMTLCAGLFVPAYAAAAPADMASSQFTDVPEGAWCAEALQTAVEHGWLKGYGDGRFGPEDVVHADQVAQVIYNIAPEELKSSYRDYQDNSNGYWAFSVVTWIEKEGIMAGTQPDASTTSYAEYGDVKKAMWDCACRRDKCAAAFARLARGYGLLDPGYYEAEALNIPDLADVEGGYKSDVKLAYFNGLIHGTGDGYFHPGDTLTRAELVQILANFMGSIEGKEYDKESAKRVFDPTKEKYIGWNSIFDYDTPEYGGKYVGDYEGWTFINSVVGYVKNEDLGTAHGMTVEEYLSQGRPW